MTGPPTSWRRSPLTAVAVTVGAACAVPFVVRGVGMPLGPDAPVYLWWYRLVELEGLGVVSKRPGALALALVSDGPVSLGAAPAVIALEVGTAVVVGMAIAILARRAGVTTWLGQASSGIFAGILAFGLSAGWVSNAVFAVCFLAAVLLLTDEQRRSGPIGPGVALGAALLSHPLFFALGAAILLISAAIAWFVGDRAWGRDVLGALALGGALGVAGLLWIRPDSSWVDLPTSGDGLFRAAGLADLLRSRYWEGFIAQWGRGLWLVLPIPLALLGLARGRAGRIAAVWMALCLLAVPVFLATGVAPAARLPRWAAVPLPIFLALAAERVGRGEVSGAVKKVLVAGAALCAAGLLVAAATLSPTFTTGERFAIVRAVGVPSREVPIVGTLDDEPVQPANRVVEVWNELRATLPATDARRVFVFYGSPKDLAAGRATTTGGRVDRALSSTTGAWIREVGGTPWDAGRGVAHESTRETAGELEEVLQPAGRSDSVIAWILAMGLWCLVGWGWARDGDPATRFAMATILGVACLVWGAFLVDRLGFDLASGLGGAAAIIVALGVSWGSGCFEDRVHQPRSDSP